MQATPTARSFHLGIYCDTHERGGAEVNLSRVLKALPETIHVTLIGIDEGVIEWLAGHRPEASTAVIADIENRWDVAGMFRHRALFKRLRTDILEFSLSSGSSCQWAMLAALSIPGQRNIALEHSPMSVWSPSSARLKRFTSGRLNAHFAVGERTARIIEETSQLPTGSITTLYHGVPEANPIDAPRPAQTTLLTVARHDPVKGVDVAIEAFSRIRTDARLVLIGSGTETASLKRQCTALGLDAIVEFRETPFETRASDLMSSFDGLVLPSRLEGFPVTVAEAMLAGLPVIATDVGSVREAVQPGVTGWIVPPNDPDALAQAIDELVDDRSAAATMGERGREIARSRFTMDATVAAYLELFGEVLAGSRPAQM